MGKYIKEKGEKMSTDINTTNPYKRYEATVWRNDETLINQERLNKIEEGIVQLQRGESIVIGTINSARLQIADSISGATVATPAGLGAVQVYSGDIAAYPNLGEGNPNLHAGFCVSPKLLNDLYKNSAEPVNIDGKRIAKKAVTATQLEKNVKITLTGGVSSNTISFNQGKDLTNTLTVEVLGEMHTHNLDQLVNCNSTTTRPGLVQIVSNYEDITSKGYEKNTIQVPNAALFKEVSANHENLISSLQRVSNSILGSIENIKSLTGTEVENTALKQVQKNTNTLKSWHKTFTETTLPKVQSDINTNTTSIASLKKVSEDYITTKTEKISKIDSIETNITSLTTDLTQAKNNIKSLANKDLATDEKIKQIESKLLAIESIIETLLQKEQEETAPEKV